MDILVEPNKENARRIIKSLAEFGFKIRGLEEKDFTQKGKIIQLGYEPVRVDLMTSLEGCGFREVWKNRAVGIYGKQKTFFIGLDELIKNKKKSERKKDGYDVSLLIARRKKNKR